MNVNEFKSDVGARMHNLSENQALNFSYDKEIILSLEDKAIGNAIKVYGARAMLGNPADSKRYINDEMNKMVASAGNMAALYRSFLAERPQKEAAFFVANISKGISDLRELSSMSEAALSGVSNLLIDRIAFNTQRMDAISHDNFETSPHKLRSVDPEASKLYGKMANDIEFLKETMRAMKAPTSAGLKAINDLMKDPHVGYAETLSIASKGARL